MKDNFFTLYPAIDIKDGKCVRLLFGEMEKETVYNNNPLDQAMWFVDQGAEWLHIVDLDGAVAGENINKRVIEEILHKLQNKVKIQLGGGIRNINDIDFWIQNSVNRVILGTLALENPNFINQLDKVYSKKIVVAFSGGADSTLSLLATIANTKDKSKITALHINQKKSKNSDVWEMHCKDFCDTRKINFISKNVEINVRGQGFEAAARNERRKIFQHFPRYYS